MLLILLQEISYIISEVKIEEFYIILYDDFKG